VGRRASLPLSNWIIIFHLCQDCNFEKSILREICRVIAKSFSSTTTAEKKIERLSGRTKEKSFINHQFFFSPFGKRSHLAIYGRFPLAQRSPTFAACKTNLSIIQGRVDIMKSTCTLSTSLCLSLFLRGMHCSHEL
jgi:hypothetical protein